jgi:hypothetical protein
MPAGLEGLFAGVGAASLVSQAQDIVAPAPATAAPRRADVPAPLAHVAWADAWLARVAGREDVVATPSVSPRPALGLPMPVPALPEPTSAAQPFRAVSVTADPRLPERARPITPETPVAQPAAVAAPAHPAARAESLPSPVYLQPETAPAPQVRRPVDAPLAAPVAAVRVATPQVEMRAVEPAAPLAPAPVVTGAPVVTAAPQSTATETAQPQAPVAAPAPAAQAAPAPLALPLELSLAAPTLGLGAGLASSPVAAALGERGIAPTSAPLAPAIARAHSPLSHIAWADAWLHRFTGGVAPEALPVVGPDPRAPQTVTPTARVTAAPALPVIAPLEEAPVAGRTTSAPRAQVPAPTPAAQVGAQPPAPVVAPTAAVAPPAPTVMAPPSPGISPSLFASPASPALGDLLGLPPAIMQRLAAAVAPPLAGPVTTVPGPALSTTAPALPGAAPVAGRAPSIQSLVSPEAPAPTPTAAPARPVLGRTPPTSPDRVDVGQPALGFRPGSVGMQMEAYAIEEKLRVSGLALDYVTPELHGAAQMYGFGPSEAVRAAHLAELGRPLMTALAATTGPHIGTVPSPSMPQVSAVSEPGSPPAVARPGAPAVAAGSPATFAAAAPTPTASPAARLAPSLQVVAGLPEPSPRGAFLNPRVAMEHLRTQPQQPGAPEGSGPQPLRTTEMAALDVLAAQAIAGNEEIGSHVSGSALVEARAALGEDFVYAGNWAWSSPRSIEGEEQLEAAPVIKAARALARMAARGMPHVELPGAEASASPVAARAGAALQSWVTPGVSSSSSSSASSRGGYSTPASGGYVRTSTSGASSAASTSSAIAGLGGPGSDFQVPDWFESAARKLLADKGSDSSFGVPELLLINAAASSPARIAAAAAQDSAPAATHGGGGGGGGGGGDKKEEEIEELALEVYGEICRLIEAHRERGGD